jgi:predicted nucleotidyltransferase
MDLQERLRERAASLPEVRLAVLFGSTARGQARKGGDVDLGLLLEPDTQEGRLKTLEELERAVDRKIDVALLNEVKPALGLEITRNGILLFEREEGLWTDFRVRAMVAWWDWAPYAKMFAEAAERRRKENPANVQT